MFAFFQTNETLHLLFTACLFLNLAVIVLLMVDSDFRRYMQAMFEKVKVIRIYHLLIGAVFLPGIIIKISIYVCLAYVVIPTGKYLIKLLNIPVWKIDSGFREERES